MTCNALAPDVVQIVEVLDISERAGVDDDGVDPLLPFNDRLQNERKISYESSRRERGGRRGQDVRQQSSAQYARVALGEW